MIAESMDDDYSPYSIFDKLMMTSGITAIKSGDEVYLKLKSVHPDELRRLADALEQLNVKDVRAITRHQNPQDRTSF